MSYSVIILMFIDKEYQCVCHTFHQEIGLNCWKIVFVLVPTGTDLEVSYQLTTIGTQVLCILMCLFCDNRY